MLRHAIAALLACAAVDAAERHPRLFFGPGDLPALRAKVAQEPWSRMAARLREDLDRDQWSAGPARAEDDSDRMTVMLRHAFLHVLTGDDAHARAAREAVEWSLAHPAWWHDERTKGLTLYWHGAKVAMAYDWCATAPSWDAPFAARVSEALRRQADAIFDHGGSEQNRSPASNWQGGRFAAAGLCMLASDAGTDAARLRACHDHVAAYLRENLGDDPRSRGWNSEGLGYTFYPMGNFVSPFAIALQRADASLDLRQACPAARWQLWTCFAATVPYAGRSARPDFGDDNPGTAGEGTLGQAFWWGQDAVAPGLAWAYERQVGAKGPGTYDHARAGTIWSILLYPGPAVAEADPLTLPAWREAMIDDAGNGISTFRNHYRQDGTDIVCQVNAKLRAPGGHGGPDALSFRILGLGGAFAVGGGRYGPKHLGQDAYWRSQNTVYPVHPDERLTISRGTGALLGTPSFSDGGGTIAMRADPSNVGTAGMVRRMAVDFVRSGAAGAVVVADTSADGTHWQLCVPSDHAIATSPRGFTVTSPQGATLVATVVHPPRPEIAIGERPRGSGGYSAGDRNAFATVSGGDGAFVVVMTLQPAGAVHPAVAARGAWSPAPAGEIAIGGWTVEIAGDRIAGR